MDLPFVSILIPIRNEAAYIERCLQAVLAQDYPAQRIEILVADGMSTDGTQGIIQQLQPDHPQIQLFKNPGEIVPTGLNILIRQAQGDILIRVDGHCVISPSYVTNCVQRLQKSDVDGVGGPMHSIGEDNLSQAIALGMSSKFGVGGSSFRTETGKTKLVDTVPFPAYSRAIIEKVGLYDEELVRNQDDEYNYRIRKHGGKILLAQEIQSTYYSRGALNKLWKQYFQYGYYKVRVLQKHPRQMSLRQFVPPLFIAAIIMSIFLSVFLPWGWMVLVGIILTYCAACLGAAFVTAGGKGWRTVWLLPAVYATMHIAYGSGFLAGLIKFWNRWKDHQGQVPELDWDNG